ncbi:hypothetical protein EJ08DRAFT_695480 [Tothia fuscella]|uniref:Uncharacterized protein n=1 Tax=Tothia fuscella TaxID=1048955 RepID=A0A9P4NUA5_9PEZI|nr:hypothetical protein EJ08DRAFT_695480 [Tothia fuscella]
MPPKQQAIRGRSNATQEKGMARKVVEEITSPDNRQVITAVGLFVAGVAFLHSSLSEILLPP